MVVIRTVPNQETQTTEYVEQLRTDIQGWLGNTSDPLYYAVEFIVQQQRVITELLNESGIALSIARATGTDLDDIIPVSRDGRTDTQLRLEFERLLQSHSGDTDEFVVRHIVTQEGILGAHVIRLPGYAIDIYVIGAEENTNGLPSPAEITAASTYINGSGIKPWFSTYNVLSASEYTYKVSGKIILLPTADTERVRSNTHTALIAAMSSLRNLNVGVYESKLKELIWQPEFLDCELTLTIETPSGRQWGTGTDLYSFLDADAVTTAGQIAFHSDIWRIYPRPSDLAFFHGLKPEQTVKITDGTKEKQGVLHLVTDTDLINPLTDVVTFQLDTTGKGTVTAATDAYYIEVVPETNTLPPFPNIFYKGREDGSLETDTGTPWTIYRYGEAEATYSRLLPTTP